MEVMETLLQMCREESVKVLYFFLFLNMRKKAEKKTCLKISVLRNTLIENVYLR